MPVNDYRFLQIYSTDITGSDAFAQVTLDPKRDVQTNAIDGDKGQPVTVRVKLNASERQAIQDVRDRAALKIDARRLARSNDQAVVLTEPLPNEAE